MKRRVKKILGAILIGIVVIVFYCFYGVLKTVEENSVDTIGVAEKEENNEIPVIYYNFLLNFDTEEKQYYYAFIELENYEYPILLISDGVYKDNQSYVAMWTDVYYYVDGGVIDFGNLLSGGTAYPIAVDETGIYKGSGHSVEKYKLNIGKQILQLVESCTAYFNSKREVTYIAKIDDYSKISTAKECEEQNEKYADANVIHFRELVIN